MSFFPAAIFARSRAVGIALRLQARLVGKRLDDLLLFFGLVIGEGLLDEPYIFFCLNFVLPKNFGLVIPLTVRNSVSHWRLAKP